MTGDNNPVGDTSLSFTRLNPDVRREIEADVATLEARVSEGDAITCDSRGGQIRLVGVTRIYGEVTLHLASRPAPDSPWVTYGSWNAYAVPFLVDALMQGYIERRYMLVGSSEDKRLHWSVATDARRALCGRSTKPLARGIPLYAREIECPICRKWARWRVDPQPL